MSARSRPPTDEVKTQIFDPEKHTDRTKVDRPKPPTVPAPVGAAERPAPKPSGVPDRTRPKPPTAPVVPVGVAERAPKPPVLPVGGLERSGPIKVISMKTPAEIAAERVGPVQARPPVPKAQLRAMGDIATRSRKTPQHGLGNFAPPRDAREARGRLWWSNTFWGAVAVIIASLVTLVIWLIAGRR